MVEHSVFASPVQSHVQLFFNLFVDQTVKPTVANVTCTLLLVTITISNLLETGLALPNVSIKLGILGYKLQASVFVLCVIYHVISILWLCFKVHCQQQLRK